MFGIPQDKLEWLLSFISFITPKLHIKKKKVVTATQSRIRESNERTIVNNGRVTGPLTALQCDSADQKLYTNCRTTLSNHNRSNLT